MQGPDIENREMQGIVPRMVRTVFNRIDNSSENIEFLVKVSMVEIYMEKIKDLLDPRKTNLTVHTDKVKGVYVQDLTERYIASEREVVDVMQIGNGNRSIGCTEMNAESSRSHSIFIMTVTQTNLEDNSCKSGMLYLVDLAGSEKVGKTGAKGQTLDEAKNINKSLSALGKVINALSKSGKEKFIPYRESKLTRMLSESLGGNAKTCLIVTGSPSSYNEPETNSTMRFGTLARNIKNKPKINKELTVGELKSRVKKVEKQLQYFKFRCEELETLLSDNEIGAPDNKMKEFMQTIPKKEITEEEVKGGDIPDSIPPESDIDEMSSVGFSDTESLAFTEDAGVEEIRMNDFTVVDADLGEYQEQILELKEQLKIEKDNFKVQSETLSNMNEDFQEMQQKFEALDSEKEGALQEKSNAILAI